jgi:hypothetical protein
LRLGSIGADCFDGINGNDWRHEQFAGAGDVLGAVANPLTSTAPIGVNLLYPDLGFLAAAPSAAHARSTIDDQVSQCGE